MNRMMKWFQNWRNYSGQKNACKTIKGILTLHHQTEINILTNQINKTTMTNNMSIVAAKALPALSGESLTYNAEKNLYLTTGYTSMAGNTYFRAIRFSPRLAVYYHIGVGYAYTFLNGITLYCWDGLKPKMIAQKFFNCNYFSESSAREQTLDLLKSYLGGQAKMLGQYVTDQQLLDCSRQMVDEVQCKRLA